MAAPVPVRGLLLGKNPAHLQACIDTAAPDFVRKASSVDDAKKALSALLNGKEIQFVAMGGGFTMADFEELHQGNAASIPWYRPETTKPGYDGPPMTGPPSPETVASKLRKGLDEHVEDMKAGKGAGEVWYF
ncbi:hypothetical protein PMZ80_002376 [Knufia obscura]|uniref:Uncharacterized protein n=1 Tax=Knufia obscura TaxID=1635080 RepID=A0ABR0RXP2_9EURO|nr:hypothetical protein PMZ80_002376 [Knufia obscura]